MKRIVVCFDGTWNKPADEALAVDQRVETNVRRFYQSITDRGSDGAKQVKWYDEGVGTQWYDRYIGGAIGTGLELNIIQGYEFLAKEYEDGAEVYVVGFSRGAYTARALAGLIASEGVLTPELTIDKELAYRAGAEAWYQYRQKTAPRSKLARLWEVASDLPRFLSEKSLKATDFVPVDEIAAVAVWDTVGALGIPRFKGNGRVDAFRFCDTKLSKKVIRGFHAVALDEQRCDFESTLWDSAPKVKQVVFPGAHCGVGGGYPMIGNESGLSDGGLRWMMDQLTDVGVCFSAREPYQIAPSHLGIAHKPWLHSPWNYPGVTISPRSFPKDMEQHQSIELRMREVGVIQEPGEAAMAYDPASLRLIDAPELLRAASV
jgi:uncharacterized protein (DUF2235 family)